MTVYFWNKDHNSIAAYDDQGRRVCCSRDQKGHPCKTRMKELLDAIDAETVFKRGELHINASTLEVKGGFEVVSKRTFKDWLAASRWG